MKCLIVAAFMVCSCAVAHAQQTNSQKDTPPVKNSASENLQATSVSPLGPPPEPLFVISERGINKEASKEDLEKLSITQVASVELLIDRELLEAYGEKGKNGVMIISLKED